MKKRMLSLLLTVVMVLGLLPAQAAAVELDGMGGQSIPMTAVSTREGSGLTIPAALRDIYQNTAANLLSQTPGTGSIGGEWLMLGLARSTCADQISDSSRTAYLAALRSYIAENYSGGKLHRYKPTENARISLALKALGYDPGNFEGYDLLTALTNTAWTTQQGNNSTAFALITFNAAGYSASNRDELIQSLLTNQLSSGAWSISGSVADQDTTMMVVQSLAPYYTRAEVKTAVDSALTWIRTLQGSDGGFGTTVEGNAQVIVALTALNIDPTGTDWTKDGKNVIDALAGYYTTTGGTGFMHAVAEPQYNQMATEQSFYALVAYIRYLNRQPGLYDMSKADSWPSGGDTPSQPSGSYAITVLGDSSKLEVPASAEAGAQVTVTAVSGYTLTGLSVWCGSVQVTARPVSGGYTFEMPVGDVVVVPTVVPAVEVDDLVGQMESFAVYAADKATYDQLQLLQAAYDALSREQADAMEGLADAYRSFQSEKREFNDLLDDCIDEALDELEWAYDRLDRDDYSSTNWKLIREIRTNAKKSIRNAQYKEQVDLQLSSALTNMSGVTVGGGIEVTFRLIGDLSHSTAGQHEKYITWVETTEYELESGATVYDLFVEAMADAGLNHKGASSNYVSTIQAPKCMGGYWLGEFDNGRNSGWMYTVNGSHPNVGLRYCALSDGDEVVWHYVDDYIEEEYRDTWLEAKDISPESYVEELMKDILTVGSNGSATPSKLTAKAMGSKVTFRFVPDNGYVVKNVTVDGKAMGSITSYTYSDLSISSRVSVEFAKKAEMSFRDVRRSDWFYEDVEFVLQNGLFEGTGEDMFSPNGTMTRGMLAAVLYRLEGEPKVYGSSAFRDVASGQWYTEAIIWAQQNDIVNGIGGGLFGVNGNVTREQLAAILYRYASYRKYRTYSTTSLGSYSDQGKISEYALTAVKWANAEGLLSGRTNTTLDPQGTASRAEVAAIFHRFVENLAQ